jgi:hypothetical protein
VNQPKLRQFGVRDVALDQLCTIRHPRRDELAAHLSANGVQTKINCPTALSFLAAYSRLKQ